MPKGLVVRQMVSMPIELRNVVEKEAKEQGRSISNYIQQILKKELNFKED